MKKLLLIATALLIANPAFAEKPATGGFSGGFTGPSTSNVITVEAAKKLSDDTDVVLVGSITNHISGEKYMFKDATGSIVVEIDKDDWNGQNVSPEDKVQIIGEIDKNLMQEPKIDVDKITKLAK